MKKPTDYIPSDCAKKRLLPLEQKEYPFTSKRGNQDRINKWINYQIKTGKIGINQDSQLNYSDLYQLALKRYKTLDWLPPTFKQSANNETGLQ